MLGCFADRTAALRSGSCFVTINIITLQHNKRVNSVFILPLRKKFFRASGRSSTRYSGESVERRTIHRRRSLRNAPTAAIILQYSDQSQAMIRTPSQWTRQLSANSGSSIWRLRRSHVAPSRIGYALEEMQCFPTSEILAIAKPSP